MWCLALTGPCCCGPCQALITTGAKIVFYTNIIFMILVFLLSSVMLGPNSALVIFLCKFHNYLIFSAKILSRC